MVTREKYDTHASIIQSRSIAIDMEGHMRTTGGMVADPVGRLSPPINRDGHIYMLRKDQEEQNHLTIKKKNTKIYVLSQAGSDALSIS